MTRIKDDPEAVAANFITGQDNEALQRHIGKLNTSMSDIDCQVWHAMGLRQTTARQLSALHAAVEKQDKADK